MKLNRYGHILKKGNQPLVLISYGPSLDLLDKALKSLKIEGTIINARFIKPIDEHMLKEIFSQDVKVFSLRRNIKYRWTISTNLEIYG